MSVKHKSPPRLPEIRGAGAGVALEMPADRRNVLQDALAGDDVAAMLEVIPDDVAVDYLVGRIDRHEAMERAWAAQ